MVVSYQLKGSKIKQIHRALTNEKCACGCSLSSGIIGTRVLVIVIGALLFFYGAIQSFIAALISIALMICSVAGIYAIWKGKRVYLRISRVGIFIEFLISLLAFIGGFIVYQDEYARGIALCMIVGSGVILIMICVLWRATSKAIRLLDEIKTQTELQQSQSQPIEVCDVQSVPPPPPYSTQVQTDWNIAPSAPAAASFDSEQEGAVATGYSPVIPGEGQSVQYI